MDPYIDVGTQQVLLSVLRRDQLSRARFLTALHRSASSARCLCADTPVEMGVAKRNDAVPIYYLYHLHRNDPSRHHIECPHRVEQADTTGLPEPPHIEAAAPQEHSSRVVHTPLLEPRAIEPQKIAVLTGLPALMEAVLVSCGLNVWHPGYISHRSYFQARFRIIEAAKRIRPFGSSTLSDILFFPPLWNPARRDDLDFEWNCFLQQLQPTAENTIPRGVVMGRLRTIQYKQTWTAPRIQLSEWNQSLWLDSCPNLIQDDPTDDFTWLVMLAVEAVPNSSKIRVIDGHAIRMTPHWLPVFSGAHARLANDLVRQLKSFTTSLYTDPSTSWAVPDFTMSTRSGPPRRVSPYTESVLRSAEHC